MSAGGQLRFLVPVPEDARILGETRSRVYTRIARRHTINTSRCLTPPPPAAAAAAAAAVIAIHQQWWSASL